MKSGYWQNLLLSCLILSFSFRVGAQCTAPAPATAPSCGAPGETLLNSNNQSFNSTTVGYYNGSGGTFSNTAINSTAWLIVCGSVTLTTPQINGNGIVVEPGATLTIINSGGIQNNGPIVNYGTLNLNGGTNTSQFNKPVWNYGTLGITGSLTINGAGNLYNVNTTSVVTISGDLTANNGIVNNGRITTTGTTTLNSGGSVCLGGGSNFTTGSLLNNKSDAFTVSPNGANTAAGLTVKTKISANDDLTSSGNLDVCEAPGIDSSAFNHHRGSAVMETNCTNIVLPVTLVSFSAQSGLGNACTLTWVTSMEKDVNDFDLEYSMDGKDFSTLSIFTARNEPSTYSYPTTVVARTWFRLRIDNKDGSSSYSQVVEADYKGDKPAATYVMAVQPNLITGGSLNVWSSMQTAQTGEWVVVDMAGRILVRQQAHLEAGSANTAILLPNLSSGMYRLLFLGGQVQLKPVPFCVIR